MLFTCAEDFFHKASKIKRLSRQEEKDLFVCRKAGDMTARERIIESYLVIVAARIRRLPKDMQSLDLIYSCIQALCFKRFWRELERGDVTRYPLRKLEDL